MHSENATFNMVPTKHDDDVLLDPPKPPTEPEGSLYAPKPQAAGEESKKPKSDHYRVGRRLGKFIGGLTIMFLSVIVIEVMALVVVWLFKLLAGLL